MRGIINRKKKRKLITTNTLERAFAMFYNACLSAGFYDVHVTLQ